MAIAARTVDRRRGRLPDRAWAGELLRPLLRRAARATPIVVGVGAGGLAVAAHAAGPGSPLGVLGVEEFDLPDPFHPGTSYGAVSGTGRTLLRSPGVARLAADPTAVRKAVRDARLILRASPWPEEHTGPVVGGRDVAGREVVLVDDGGSAPTRLAAALDFIRRYAPSRVVLAVACAPVERIHEMEQFAGDVVVGVVPTWAEWFGWHGELYESGGVPTHSEVGRPLRG